MNLEICLSWLLVLGVFIGPISGRDGEKARREEV
jgi:hypothetical protein